MSSGTRPPKVAVIVPVYNPGANLKRCTDSVLAQTMPPGEFEAVFVDDGSTDGTGAVLDAIAAAHPHVRVIHQENSGWAGRPRNVGIDAATADYVLFVDADDALGPEAAARLHARAVADDSDVVLGRSVGHGRPNSSQLSWQTRGPMRFEEDPGLISHLKTHKLMRRAFLDEHRLRFPEGKRRLEDQIFVLEAYFLAKGISVVGDYVCYHHHRRRDRAGLAAQPWEPADYYRSVRENIDVIERYTQPGAFRNRLLHRMVGNEMLKRLSGPLFLSADPRRQQGLLREIRSILVDRIPPIVDETLIPPVRTVAALARADRLDLLVQLAEAEGQSRPTATVRRAELRPDTGLELEIDIALRHVPDGIAIAPNPPTGWDLVVPRSIEQIVPPAERRTDRPITGVIDLLAIDAKGVLTSMSTTTTFVEVAGPDGTQTWRIRATAVLPLSALLPRNGGRSRRLRFFARLHLTPHFQRAKVRVKGDVPLRPLVVDGPHPVAGGASSYVLAPMRMGRGGLVVAVTPNDLRSRLRRNAIRVRSRLIPR